MHTKVLKGFQKRFVVIHKVEVNFGEKKTPSFFVCTCCGTDFIRSDAYYCISSSMFSGLDFSWNELRGFGGVLCRKPV